MISRRHRSPVTPLIVASCSKADRPQKWRCEVQVGACSLVSWSMAKSSLHPPFPRFPCFFSTGRPLELSKGQVPGHAGGGDNKRKLCRSGGLWRDVKVDRRFVYCENRRLFVPAESLRAVGSPDNVEISHRWRIWDRSPIFWEAPMRRLLWTQPRRKLSRCLKRSVLWWTGGGGSPSGLGARSPWPESAPQPGLVQAPLRTSMKVRNKGGQCLS